MNELPNAFKANLCDFESAATSPTLPSEEQKAEPPCRPLDQWMQDVMRHMQRMAMDEEYRKSIAQHLS